MSKYRLRFTTHKHPPAFGITHKTITQCSPGALDRCNPGFGACCDALAAVQRGHDLLVSIGKANAGEGQVFVLAGECQASCRL